VASLHSVGIWFIHERCRVALDFFYYVVMHSAFISDELIPWTFFYYVVMHYAFISDGLMPCTSLTILGL